MLVSLITFHSTGSSVLHKARYTLREVESPTRNIVKRGAFVSSFAKQRKKSRLPSMLIGAASSLGASACCASVLLCFFCHCATISSTCGSMLRVLVVEIIFVADAVT